MKIRILTLTGLSIFLFCFFACHNNAGNIIDDPNELVSSVKFFKIEADNDSRLVYDKTYNYVIVLYDNKRIDIYNSPDMTLKKSIKGDAIGDIDTDNGILVYNECNKKRVYIFSLKNFKRIGAIKTSEAVSVGIDGDIIILGYQTKQFFEFYNYKTKKSTTSKDAFDLDFTLNRKDHIMYIAQTHGGWPCALTYLDSHTGKVLFETKEYGSNRFNAYFDGIHVRAFGRCFDRLTGELYTNLELDNKFSSINNFIYNKIIYDSSDYVFVSGMNYKSEDNVLVYSYKSNSIIYSFDFETEPCIWSMGIIEIAKNYFFIPSTRNEVAFLIIGTTID